jgi:hypothetical protein
MNQPCDTFCVPKNSLAALLHFGLLPNVFVMAENCQSEG